MSNTLDWGEPPPYNGTVMPQRNYEEIPGSVNPAVLVVSSIPAVQLPIRPSTNEPPSYDEVADGASGDSAGTDAEVFRRTLQTPVLDGYEEVGFEPVTLIPPQGNLPAADSSMGSLQHRNIEGIPNLDDSGARDALLCQVSQSLCFGLRAAKQMHIRDIIPHSAFRYELQTYTETRKASWTYEPYTGQGIDGETNGPAPKPWDVLVVPPHPFVEGETIVEVPHTASIQSCFDCHTLGRRSCWSCYGNGQMRCSGCNGTGQHSIPADHDPASRICVQCAGNGRRRCTVCLGPGQLPCKTCLARGRLKVSLKLNVIWKTHKTDSVVERTTIPDAFLRDVIGRNVFEEEMPILQPISFFPDETINFASRELLEKHKNSLPMEKIMVQRHSVKLVPVYQVLYQWRRYHGEFYVYGFENRVHCPDYPQQQCCGIRDVWPCSMC